MCAEHIQSSLMAVRVKAASWLHVNNAVCVSPCASSTTARCLPDDTYYIYMPPNPPPTLDVGVDARSRRGRHNSLATLCMWHHCNSQVCMTVLQPRHPHSSPLRVMSREKGAHSEQPMLRVQRLQPHTAKVEHTEKQPHTP